MIKLIENKVPLKNGKIQFGDCCCGSTCQYGEWYPDPAEVCDGQLFDQYRYDNNGVCPEQYQEATGTAVANYGEWQPDSSQVCFGQEFDQYRHDDSEYGLCPSLYRRGTGTSVPNYTAWSPDSSEFCLGDEFQQSRYDNNGVCPWEYQQGTGTSVPNYTAWSPDSSTRCSGHVFNQYRYDNNGRCPWEYQQGTGTAVANYSEWHPDSSEVCLGNEFRQYRYDHNRLCPDQFQQGIGTKAPNYTEWEPDPSTICSGVEFTQTRSDLNNCQPNQSRTATGIFVNTNVGENAYLSVSEFPLPNNNVYRFTISSWIKEEATELTFGGINYQRVYWSLDNNGGGTEQNPGVFTSSLLFTGNGGTLVGAGSTYGGGLSVNPPGNYNAFYNMLLQMNSMTRYPVIRSFGDPPVSYVDTQNFASHVPSTPTALISINRIPTARCRYVQNNGVLVYTCTPDCVSILGSPVDVIGHFNVSNSPYGPDTWLYNADRLSVGNCTNNPTGPACITAEKMRGNLTASFSFLGRDIPVRPDRSFSPLAFQSRANYHVEGHTSFIFEKVG